MYSFDVFDTLVSRTTSNPKQIFSLMQEYICQHSDEFAFLSDECKRNFAFLREEAEDLAGIFFVGQEIDLEQIYDSFFKMSGESNKWINQLMKLEIQFEMKNSMPIVENIAYLEELIDMGEEVILISDMYHTEQVIRDILIQHDDVFKNIPLYVSCECGVSKASGLLYVSIKKERGVSYSKWTHIGDNEFSDGRIPELLGIKTRIVKPRETSKEYLVGYNIGGRVLYPYVKWIMDMCENKGYEKIFFIARDGYVLKKIADIIIETSGLGLETRYIYLSRNAVKDENHDLLRAYIEQETNGDFHNIAWVDLQGTGKTLEILSSMFECSFNVFYYYLAEYNIRENNYHVYASKRKGNIIETLCRAPHGVTIGYRQNNNKWEPIFEKDYRDKGYENRIVDYTKGVIDYSKRILRLQEINEVTLDLRKKSKELTDECFENPNTSVAEFIGDIYHGNDNECDLLFAPKIKDADITKYYYNPQSYKGLYYDYSLKRATKEQQELDKSARDEMKRNLNQYITGEYIEDKINIILYGAGKNSWKKVIQYGISDDINVVAWTDANAKKHRKEYAMLMDFAEAKQKVYDFIVITIQSDNIISQVKELLTETGISCNKIVSIYEFEDETFIIKR